MTKEGKEKSNQKRVTSPRPNVEPAPQPKLPCTVNPITGCINLPYISVEVPPFEDIDDDGNYIGNDPKFYRE